jgi:hypothetical protein
MTGRGRSQRLNRGAISPSKKRTARTVETELEEEEDPLAVVRARARGGESPPAGKRSATGEPAPLSPPAAVPGSGA